MESLFGECNNRFTVELLSELFLLNQSEIIRILKKNISNFEFSYCSQSAISEMDLDGQCIVDNFSDNELKYTFILSMRGLKKFTNILMNEFKGFFVRFLTEKEINELLKIVYENDSVKDYKKGLVAPRGEIGREFRKIHINPFWDKVNEELKMFIIDWLGVDDVNHIPWIAYQQTLMIIKFGYNLSPELRNEAHIIWHKLVDLRCQVNDGKRKLHEGWLLDYDKQELKSIRKFLKFLKDR